MICHHVQEFVGWFFGDTKNVQFGDVHSFDYDDPWTLSFWITVGPGASGNIVTKYLNDDLGANTRRGWGCQLPSSGKVRFYLGNNLGSTQHIVVDTDATITDGVQHHITLSYTGSTLASGVSIGIDGVNQAITTVNDTLGSNTTLSSAIMQIGGNDGVGSFGPGEIHDVALYNVALNSTQKSELYNSGTPPSDLYALATTPDPLLWIKLNELDTDDPEGVIDYGTEANNGTANFSPYETVLECTDAFEPIQDGYTNEFGQDVIEIPLSGGPSRKHLDIYFAGHIVNVSWLLTREEYTEFMGYFRTTLAYGSEPFLIDLITDIGVPTTHLARTLGGLPKLTRQSGDAYYVTCTLQCERNPTFTGNIIYQEDGDVIFATDNPPLTERIQVGDTIRIIDSAGIHPTGNTPLNLDGVYTVANTTGFNVITLDDPASVNSDWAVLAALGTDMQYGDVDNGDVISTLTRVPQ